jgi:hypothetical protein
MATVAAGNVLALWGPPNGNWFYAVGEVVQQVTIE